MNDCGAQAEGGGPKAFAARNVGKNSGPLIAEHEMCDTGAPMSVGPSAVTLWPLQLPSRLWRRGCFSDYLRSSDR